MGASVKIMLSYDYCHFEVCKSTDGEVSDNEIDELRKDVQRLADKAVRQYQVAKDFESKRVLRQGEYDRMRMEVERIKRQAAILPEQQATIKAFEDRNWSEYLAARYDYEDEFDEDEEL